MANVRTARKDNRSLRGGAFAALMTLLAAFPAAAQTAPAPTITIAWAAGAYGNQRPDYAPVKNLASVPDGKCTFVSRSSWIVTATFNQKFTYPKLDTDPNLVTVLGLSADDLRAYDIIAFEGNSSKLQFENSVWFVTDNVAWAAGTFLGDVPPPDSLPPQQLRFRAGWMPFGVYKKIFHIREDMKDAKGRPINWVGWIVVDIPDRMKMDLEHLKLFLTGVHKSGTISKLDGSPDPDAVGLIVH